MQQAGQGCPTDSSPAHLAARGSAAWEMLVGGLSSTWAGVLMGKAAMMLPGSQLRGWDHAEPSSIHHGLLPRWATLLHPSWMLVGTSLQLPQTTFTWDLALSLFTSPQSWPLFCAPQSVCIKEQLHIGGCLLHPTTMSQSGARSSFCWPLFCMTLPRGMSPGFSSHLPWWGAGREVSQDLEEDTLMGPGKPIGF